MWFFDFFNHFGHKQQEQQRSAAELFFSDRYDALVPRDEALEKLLRHRKEKEGDESF